MKRLLCILLVIVLAPDVFSQDTQAKTMEVRKLIESGEFDAAAKQIDEIQSEEKGAMAAVGMRQTLAMALLSKNRNQDAIDQIVQTIDFQLAKLEASPDAPVPMLGNSLMVASSICQRAGKPETAEELQEKSLQIIQGKLPKDKLSPLHSVYSSVLRGKAARLSSKGDKDSARALIQSDLDEATRLVAADPENPNAPSHVISVMGNLLSMSEDAQVQSVVKEIHKFAKAQIEKKATLPMVTAYNQAVAGLISRTAREMPAVAEEALGELHANLLAAKESLGDEGVKLDVMIKSLDRNRSTIETGKKIVAMIGSPAPKFDIGKVVNGAEFKQEDLKGKVVLVDFWAVWCGPCIATFPHLRHLQEEYGPKGLEIVGVTRQYNYKWDTESKKAKRVDEKEEKVGLEEELEMLGSFMASYDLKHRTIVTNVATESEGDQTSESSIKKKSMMAEYAVTGIPHVCLIDKSGAVRLVKIGSGEKNSQDIEAMIQKLLAE